MNVTCRWKAPWVVCCLAMAVSSPAAGQASPQAEALFRDGKRLMKGGDIAAACAAFEGSERAEHNIATVLSLADCREKNHQNASAWALFLQADSQTRADPAKSALNQTAKARAAALEHRLSYLTIRVASDRLLSRLTVTRDGVPVDPAAWNRPIPIDGGDHTVTSEAPGHVTWSAKVSVAAEFESKSVDVPMLVPEPVPVVAPAPSVVQHSVEQAPVSAGPYRRISIGVVAGGVATAGVAIYLGLHARSLHEDADTTCTHTACTTAQARSAQDKNDRAVRDARYANIGFGIAAAAVIGGAVLWWVGSPGQPAPQGRDVGLALAPLPAGVALIWNGEL